MSIPSTDRTFYDLLTGSCARLCGHSLDPEGRGPEWLYEQAPFVLLAHDTAPDPLFIYANRTAQALFGYEWSEFLALPSRLSAKTPDRSERQRLFDAVRQSGFVTDASGIRTTKSGALFRIERAVIWQLVDDDGRMHGEAATFGNWTMLTETR